MTNSTKSAIAAMATVVAFALEVGFIGAMDAGTLPFGWGIALSAVALVGLYIAFRLLAKYGK